ncbi:ribosomal large subunit pseudouridine synthase B [Paucilactobacillus hokkaidonensis JCM 18461]|uniref:Pseudouridine synthase n=2 Tax=Paucilactobacillus hokkaidonensis TaxID=1193095 RepID=A0A0A1GTW5_9LACO|nr:pseudouridine synthase [Paucilactobacillus hokkaidonensis]BAP85687.1 ribosomal large subunit pseudouridine synthase B [Paucilactobacillus hokkaidonensis JCM 18461]
MERLQKVMAEAGIASRRKSEELITAGHVKVNGDLVTTLGTKVTSKDDVVVDGVPLNRAKLVYYLLNKPRGVISSAHDEKGRKTVVDILADEVTTRIYPVGRLDYDTTGLLLLTNDGELANKLTHPKYEVDKTYVAKVKGIPSNDELKQLRLGVKIDGKKARPAKANILNSDSKKGTSIISVTIHEGHNHQVKKMFEAIGHEVLKLHRESYGFLTLKGVPAGQWRELKTSEVQQLRKL